jgi:glutamyl-tRNA reductase
MASMIRVAAGGTDPLVMSLRMKVERIRQHELAKAQSRLHRLDRDGREEINRMTRSLVERILVWPASELAKESSPHQRQLSVRVLCRLFKLDQERNGDSAPV